MFNQNYEEENVLEKYGRNITNDIKVQETASDENVVSFLQ